MTSTASHLIRQALWELAAPSPVQGDSSGHYCRKLMYPTAVLAQLLDQYLEQQLIEAGVATRDADSQIMVAPPLSGGEVLLAAVRNAAGEFVDLVSERGALSGAEPALAMLVDYPLAESLASAGGMLFLTFSLADVAWLRSAGLPAIICQGARAPTIELLRSIDRAAQEILAELHACCSTRDARQACPPASAGTHAHAMPTDFPAPAAYGSPYDLGQPPSSLPQKVQAVEQDGLPGHFHFTFPPEATLALARNLVPKSPAAHPPAVNEPSAASAAPPFFASTQEPPTSSGATPDDPGTAAPLVGEPPQCEASAIAAADGRPSGIVLVLVGWSPANGSSDGWPGLAERLRELARAERLLAGDFPQMCIWSPDCNQREDLALIERYGGRERWREAALASVEDTARVLSSLPEEVPDVPYPEARSQYMAALAPASDDPDIDIEQLKQIYNNSIEKEILQPLLERAAACRSPVQSLTYASLAELGRLVHGIAPLAHAELHAPTESAGTQIQRFLQTVKVMVAAAKLVS